MSKIRIITPATTANLGPGFDFLGIALNLYNTIEFEEVKNHCPVIGFNDVGFNLVQSSFNYIINKYSDRKILVRIEMIENQIPVARGLGSSASAIVTGCVAANYFLDYKISEETLIKEMVQLEGHPDNILPCYFGGMVSSIEADKLLYFKHKVCDDLFFNVLIPKYKVKTEEARKVLPKTYSLKDVTYNASRSMLIPYALESGDIKLIKEVTNDKIHEPYRMQFIKEWEEIKRVVDNEEAKLNISGSGPTMLVISKEKEITNKIKNKNLDLEIYNLKVTQTGVQIIKM